MKAVTIPITVLFAVFSTCVMSYIAMATPIGPWIAPTLVLFGTLLFSVFSRGDYTTDLALATAGGSVGGILATACGFSFPTIYFLNPDIFNAWMAHPLQFVGIMTGLACAAGGFGFIIANMLEQSFIVQREMPFPIGQLVYKMISAHNQAKKAWELMIGFCTTIVFGLLQGGIFGLKGIIPQIYTLFNRYTVGLFALPPIVIRFDHLPMLLAIGFITGHMLAIPLAVGAISRLVIVDPLNVGLFAQLKNTDFLLAFCSGLVAIGAVQSFLDLPKLLKNFFNNLKNNDKHTVQAAWFSEMKKAINTTELIAVGGLCFVFLSVFGFSLIEQVYLLTFTFVCAYQIVTIAGKIGLAQLGRFATFVMVPALFMFGVDPIKATIIATFVEITGGVATDLLFGRKMAQMGSIERYQIRAFQLFGLLISACVVGVVFWLLINHFGLGPEGLFAQRAYARALLINVGTFDLWVLALGAVYGFLLKQLKLSPMLVLGGLLMPLPYSLGLIAGGLLTQFVTDPSEWEPFWSGVFAANSLWELVKTIF